MVGTRQHRTDDGDFRRPGALFGGGALMRVRDVQMETTAFSALVFHALQASAASQRVRASVM
jgi:hypothetical protein